MGDWSVRVNEDYPFSDKYRTFAFEGGNNILSIGTVLYTTPYGDYFPEKDDNSHNTSHLWKKARQYYQGERIYSGLYIGFRNGSSVTRIGIDAPLVNDFFQGGFHHIGQNTPLFDCGYGPGSTRPYYYQGTYNPFSLY